MNAKVDLTNGRQVKGLLPDANLASSFIKANGSVPFAADQSMGGFKLTSLANGVADTDAISLGQAKALLYGVLYTRVARASATGNINVANPGTATFDGVTLTNGDVLFLPFQTTQSQNGLYTFNGSGSALTRVLDADSSAEVQPGLKVFISEGTLYGDKESTLTTNGPITLGTTALVFTTPSTGTSYTAGNGLTLSANQFAVQPSTGISVSGAGVAIDTAVVPRIAKMITRETPGGSINGSNTNFPLANTPVSGMEMVYLNGVLQVAGAGNDYTISGSTITMLSAPQSGDSLVVSYYAQ